MKSCEETRKGTMTTKEPISELHTERLFKLTKDGILILDFETGKIVDANPILIKMLDCSFEEIAGRELWEIGIFSTRTDSVRAVAELKSNGYIRFEDIQIQNRSENPLYVDFTGIVYSDDQMKVIQCNLLDITNRKRSIKKLKESRQNLFNQYTDYLKLLKEYLFVRKELEKSRAHNKKLNDELITAKAHADESEMLKSSLLTYIEHEIRTPLHAIMGFSELLLTPGLSDEEREGYLRIIRVNSMQLMSVISDTMDISQVEAGQIKVEIEDVIINDLLEELFMTYQKLPDGKKLSLHCSCGAPNERILVKTDGKRIRQVLSNLLNNAIKFTSEGKIEFGYQLKEDLVEFFVRDSGIGIDPENHGLIFERFRKVVNPEGKIYKGTGLGLSISKALVEKLGGTISVHSELGSGSTFTFSIPYKNKSEVPLSRKYNDLDEKTILVSEDQITSHTF
jgi:signal transduction histidine kinase